MVLFSVLINKRLKIYSEGIRDVKKPARWRA
nr:MAG TPA: hypothetical protein [Caudoviricetes sp.]DAV77802.1 MAG TPA: hypothetical protein [Caudoviricetes sp.]